MVNNAPLIPPKWLQNYSTLTPLGKFCPHMQTYAYLWGWDHVATFSNTFETCCYKCLPNLPQIENIHSVQVNCKKTDKKLYL